MTTSTVMRDLAWCGPAATYGAPSLANARAYCQRLARSHYENFSVLSWLVPRDVRPDMAAIYAYCRWADDLADETNDAARSVELLDWWQRELDACYRGHATHPVFVALRDTIRRFDIPPEPFHDLLAAFRRDQRQTRYATVDDLLTYCRQSANPVGRLVLRLGRCHDDPNVALSDSICTGLQWINFCQDVARDFDRGRIYLPEATWQRHGLTEVALSRRENTAGFRAALAEEVARAEAWLNAGWPLVLRVTPWLRGPVELFIRGGLAVADGIRRIDYDVWRRRPTVSRAKKLRLVVRCCWKQATTTAAGRSAWQAESRASYRHCQRLARRAASSFYYSFWLLPADKRQAMCALYAFARATDDLGDAESVGGDRRQLLADWRNKLIAALDGQATGPLLPALADTARRFAIPTELFTAIIDGVAMDLSPRRYATFDELAVYCYHVASAVGLACIHIWGFDGPQAFSPATTLGYAFQLTNILRDLSEDATRGRVYLPLEDLARFDYSVDELHRGVADQRLEKLVQFEVDRARGLFRSAAELAPHLSPEGQRSLRGMVATYLTLLDRIERAGAEVLRRRVRLTTLEKLQCAARGLFHRGSSAATD